MSALVTGGAGFIGSHVAEHLSPRPPVVVLDDLSGASARTSRPARVRRGQPDRCGLIDGCSPRIVRLRLPPGGVRGRGLSHFIKRFNYTNNLIGSVNLINAAVNHEVKCFVFTSSIAVYGASQRP